MLVRVDRVDPARLLRIETARGAVARSQRSASSPRASARDAGRPVPNARLAGADLLRRVPARPSGRGVTSRRRRAPATCRDAPSRACCASRARIADLESARRGHARASDGGGRLPGVGVVTETCERHELATRGRRVSAAARAESRGRRGSSTWPATRRARADGLGVVGARRATPYGLACARLFAGWAASQGVVIVSGAAFGCDQAAQQAARRGGRGVGRGPRLRRGRGLPVAARAELLAQLRRTTAPSSPSCRGALRRCGGPSPSATASSPALSAALLVVEAGLPSGTFSTADHALDAGREVLAVPGSIFAPECRGSNRLIRQGAACDHGRLGPRATSCASCGLLDAASPAHGSLRRRPAADPIARALVADPMRPDDVARALALDIVDGHAPDRRARGGRPRRAVPDGRYGPDPGQEARRRTSADERPTARIGVSQQTVAAGGPSARIETA